MAKKKSPKSSSATIGFEQQIWDAACELWGHIPAADYRKIFTGLIFLKYISTAFEKRYNELVEEGDGFEDDPDAYEAENIFFVPPEARWSEIAKAAHTPEIGILLDKAMRAIEDDNRSLKGVLPKNYANPELDKRVLGNVLYSSRAPIGYIAIAKNEVTTNQGFKSVVPNNDIGNAFIYYFLKTNFDLIDSMASGSTFKEISGSAMKNVPVLVPDNENLSKFQNLCNQIFSKQENFEDENRTLSAIRNTLLPKLMSGEIEVDI